MSEKKHIDRLFQEKFKDFEAKPSSNVWAGIQNKMQDPEQKPKKVLPLWLRFASIAAALILLFTIVKLAFNNENKDNNNTTIVETKTTESINTNSKSIDTNNSKDSKNTIENNNNEGLESTTQKGNTLIVTSENNTKEVNQNEVSNLSSKASNRENTLEQNKPNTNNYVTNQNNNNSNGANGIGKILEHKIVLNSSKNSESLTQNNSVEKINKDVSNNTNIATANANNKATTNKTSITKSKALETTIPKNNINTNSITNNNSLTNKNTIDTNAIENNTATINTAVATTNSEKEKEEEKMMEPDSANSSNTIEEALAKTESLDEKEEENLDRWSVNANAAPVYYNTLGKGSHIHEQFVDNPKNGEINTSYGVNVGYALNNKLKLRSGVNKLNLSYDTANVIVYENVTNTPSSSPLRNIDFTPTSAGQTISVLSSNSLSVQQIDGFINDDLNAALSQRLSYFEVPLELEYAVVNKRFGLNIIGGFSTFILSDNEVVTEVDNRKTKIGEANNINNLSFSANAGIGIDYKFNNSIKFNLEPTFKYQINAYSETSGNFRPYIIGVYTGISYKF
ncbi:MAG: hypothetical protein QNK89_02730 [Lacinutrix sp.]|uniref:hypothetical protein n=1 Tax=Lacinutrix sp. TaxID=1937692 RepID=UPI0030B74D20